MNLIETQNGKTKISADKSDKELEKLIEEFGESNFDLLDGQSVEIIKK